MVVVAGAVASATAAATLSCGINKLCHISRTAAEAHFIVIIWLLAKSAVVSRLLPLRTPF
jgi:hypothetical protein